MEDLFCWMGEGRQPEKGAIALGGSELSCSADISGCPNICARVPAFQRQPEIKFGADK